MAIFPKPFLIIVTGRPAAGKSTLANWLAQELPLPLIGKDPIREILFDRLGWRDREWARLLGRASIDLMFYFARTQLGSGHSIIMDNAFHPGLSAPRFLALQKETNAQIIQIICDAEGHALWQRFKERAGSGSRHPGHGDHQILDELWGNLAQELSPAMALGGKTIRLQTTDFSTVDYPAILAEVKQAMEN